MPSNPPTAGRTAAAGITALALAVVVGAVAFGAGRASASTPTPTVDPTPSPTIAWPYPTPFPTMPPAITDGQVIVVLDTVDDVDPSVAIHDGSGSLADVRAGHAGDGMSTRWNTAIVEQVDPTSVQITWVGFPGAERAELAVTETDGSIELDFDQDAPPANSDALGADRVLILTFDRVVDADDVEVAFPPLEPAY
jgi:hypothetical protein